jgi:hypothetical protein
MFVPIKLSSKAKQKDLTKLDAHLSTEMEERININISADQNTSHGRANILLVIQDDFA